MDPIRVVIVDLPSLLGKMVREAIDATPDIDVVAEIGSAACASEAVETHRPSVVVCSREHDLDGLGLALLRLGPGEMRIFALDPSGRELVVHELRPHRMSLGETSPDSLIEAIRRDGGSRRAASRPRSRWPLRA